MSIIVFDPKRRKGGGAVGKAAFVEHYRRVVQWVGRIARTKAEEQGRYFFREKGKILAAADAFTCSRFRCINEAALRQGRLQGIFCDVKQPCVVYKGGTAGGALRLCPAAAGKGNMLPDLTRAAKQHITFISVKCAQRTFKGRCAAYGVCRLAARKGTYGQARDRRGCHLSCYGRLEGEKDICAA